MENALLRASLWLTARALKDYHDAPHVEVDDGGRQMREVIVPEAPRGHTRGVSIVDPGMCSSLVRLWALFLLTYSQRRQAVECFPAVEARFLNAS